MAANATYNSSNNVLTVTGNGLPFPVTSGTFPNANNTNTINILSAIGSKISPNCDSALYFLAKYPSR